MSKHDSSKPVPVVEVVCVRVNSGTISSTFTDTDAISFLQSAQFTHIKTEQPNGGHICAVSPQNEIFFLFEHNITFVSGNGFRLVRVMNNSRTIIDEGYTVFVEGKPDAKGDISIIAIGNSMKDWEFTCRIASPEKLSISQALLGQTAGVLRKKGTTRRSAEKFILSKSPAKHRLSSKATATLPRTAPETRSFIVVSQPFSPAAPPPPPVVTDPPPACPPATTIAVTAEPVVTPVALPRTKTTSHHNKPTSRRFIIPPRIR